MAAQDEAMKALNTELRGIADQVATIQEKGSKITAEEMNTLKSLTGKGKELREKLDAFQEAKAFSDWAGESKGSAVKDSHNEVDWTQEFTSLDDQDQEKRAQDAAAKRVYAGVFEGYMRGGAAPYSHHPLSTRDMKILREGAIKSARGSMKAAVEDTETSGGFSVPEDFQANVLKKTPGLSSLWDNVRHQATSRDVLVWPMIRYTTDNKYTAPHRLTWTGDVPSSSSVADVTDETWGQARIPVNLGMAGQRLSLSLMEDSAVDIMGVTQGLFRENIMQDIEYYLAQGTGGGQPEGITVNATARTNYVFAGTTTTFTADQMKAVYFGVPAQYRMQGSWVMSSVTALALNQLKDANNRYIWEDKDMFGGGLGGVQLDGIVIPVPRLLGAPVHFSEQMPSIASGAYPVVFGDLKGYIVADRVGMTVRVLNELYAETDQVKVLLRMRMGGQLVEDYKVILAKGANS